MISLNLRPADRAHAAREGNGKTIDPAQLTQRIRDGDAAAVAAFYQAVQAGIRVLFRHYLPTQESDADVRETLSATVEAIRKGELRDPQRLLGFVRGIVQRRIEERRQDEASARREEALRAEQVEAMRQVLLGLSPPEREVLLRYYVRNEPVAEICGATGLTPVELRALTTKVRDRFGALKNRRALTRCPGE